MVHTRNRFLKRFLIFERLNLTLIDHRVVEFRAEAKSIQLLRSCHFRQKQITKQNPSRVLIPSIYLKRLILIRHLIILPEYRF